MNTIHLLDDYTNVVILYIVYQMFNYSLLFYPLQASSYNYTDIRCSKVNPFTLAAYLPLVMRPLCSVFVYSKLLSYKFTELSMF